MRDTIMEIKDLKINGIKNPVGFNLKKIKLSYYIDGESNGDLFFCLFDSEKAKESIYTQQLDYKYNYCSEINFKPEIETRYWFEIKCGNTVSERCYFETGTKFDCRFITPENKVNHPVIYRNFECNNIVKARLYVTGLGLYEATLNGKKVGNEYLTPNCNDYDAYLQYQTYDISDLLVNKNLLEIALGDGWYKGRFGLKKRENIYGEEYVCAAKIVLWYKDGSKRVIATDESWSVRESVTVLSGIYDGENVDYTKSRKEICGVKFVDKTFNVIERVSVPVIVKSLIKPKLIISPIGEQILDFGQNFSGFVSFDCDLKTGQKVTLKAGEVMQGGCFYRDNLRSAKAEFTYISDGHKRNVYPKFTFFGFRYMLVEGIEKVNADDFVGNVLYSDLEDTVKISTDNAKINRLLQNCVWGQRSNFVDVPTDCPQRDERLGWTGDAEVFSTTACYQMNCQAFYAKYLKDMAIDQSNYGKVMTYSPSFKEAEVAGSVWSDAATVIPWAVYSFYGDKELLLAHYPMMEKSVEDIISEDDRRGAKRLYNFGFHLGDWLSQDGVSSNAIKSATSEYFIASCYYYNSVSIMAKAAEVLGFKDKAKRYADIAGEIKNAIIEEYFSASGRLSVDTQTAYVLCVKFDIYKNWNKLVSGFAKRMRKDCYAIKGGFVGATQLVQALVKSGLTDDAFRIVYSEKYPSWLFCVNLGATTIWERWNSLNPDGTISGTEMNSFNHYSFGAVAEAFYGYFAGVRPAAVTFKKAVIEPKFNYRMKKLDFTFKSPSGVYSVKYDVLADGKVNLTVTVPYGAEAELILEGKSEKLTGGCYNYTVAPETDLIHPFSFDSTISDVLNNEKGAAALKEVSPVLYHFLLGGRTGVDGYTFRKLNETPSFALSEQKIELLNNKLKAITV